MKIVLFQCSSIISVWQKSDDCVTNSVVCAVIKKRTGSIKGLLIKDYATIVDSCGLGVIRRDNDETVWATRFVVVL